MGFNEISSLYEVGSIVELKVEKKLLDPQLVIFNLDGVSARLDISEISNSPVLSRKLFDAIRDGEIITSVIIDFNQERKNVELSLKPFRNKLEGSLSFTKCRKIIKARKDMRINLPGDILEENRNQLDRIQGDLAKVDLTFLYELIQNAIDHPNSNFNNLLSIKFEVYNDYLLLKHNGSIFTENNFRSLTGILLGEEETDEERIGYKGIGFKSIFRYTKDVYIRSGNFSFSFSQSRSGAKTPWEVIPIFENEIDKVEEIKNFEFFNTPVAFAFKFINPELKEQAIKYLKQLVAKPETLLFLNKLVRLEIVVDGNVKKITRQVFDCNTHEKVNLQLDEEIHQEWLVCKEKHIITDEMILKELKDENNPSIPLKFRNFKTPEVQVAFPLDKRKDLFNMYAYLPLSETNCGLPYIVNGDFIPNLDRTDLIKNLKYNNALANIAAGVLSNLFKVITSEYGIEQALTLIPQFDSTSTDFFNTLNDGFIETKDALTIVLPSKQEVPLKDFVIDTCGLFSILKKEEIQLHESFKNGYVFDQINPSTAEQLKNKLGVKAFSMQHGLELLTKPMISNKYYSDFSSLAMLLFRFSRLLNAKDWAKNIGSLKLVKQKEIKYALNDLHCDVPDGFGKMFKGVLHINSLSAEGNALLKKYPRIANVFKAFGLKRFNLDEVLRQLSNVAEKLKTEPQKDHLNQVWHFLYLYRGVINADGSRLVNERFKQFPVNTVDGGVEMLENCFAGDIENSENDYSFLHDQFGKEHLSKVNIADLAELIDKDKKEVINFLGTIHDRIKLTDKMLFRRALKRICSLTKEELVSEKESVIKALLSVFSFSNTFPNDNLLDYGMFKFPVITNTDDLEQIAFTYFDNSYSSFFDENDLCAEKLFNNVDGIQFISKDYLNQVPDENKLKFIEFLKNNYVSTSIKYFDSNLFRKGDRVNLVEVDKVYQAFNNGYSNFKSRNEFYIFKDVAKLATLHENLQVFWKELPKVKSQNLILSDINCNGYSKPNPFIWLFRGTYEMFPMQGGNVKSFQDVHSKKMIPFLIESSNKLETCFDTGLDTILKALDFKSTLTNEAIISCIQNLSQLTEDNQKVLFLDYFSEANFNQNEIELIKNNCFLLAKDQSVKSAKELIYIEKELEASSLVLEQTTYSDSLMMETFDYHDGFRKKINQLALSVKGIEQIELRNFDINSSLNSPDINVIVSEFGSKIISSDAEIGLLRQSKYIACEIIKIGLSNVTDFQANVDSFYDSKNNIYYFTEIRDLIDLLCDKFDWSISVNRKLRKLLEKENTSKKDKKTKQKSTKFSQEEIFQITKLFGRELPDNELEEENLYGLVKALKYFKDKAFDVSKAEANFENNFDDKYLSPIIDENGTAYKVMCRSARRGILFFGAYAWKNLGEENTLLYVLTGDTSTECFLIKTQEELELKFDSHYKVLRRQNTNSAKLKNLIEAEVELSDLQILYKVKGSSFDIIFNPQRNKEKNTEGPLTDIGIDI